MDLKDRTRPVNNLVVNNLGLQGKLDVFKYDEETRILTVGDEEYLLSQSEKQC